MKIPDYITFNDLDEKARKYKEWGFSVGKKGVKFELLYKGCYSDNKSEKCEIVGYTDELPDEMFIVIHLKESDKDLPIDRRYLKQMQSDKFAIDQVEKTDKPNKEITVSNTFEADEQAEQLSMS